jgi:hypothetical protein
MTLPPDPSPRMPPVAPEDCPPVDSMFAVGAYVLVSGVMRSTGIQREQELLQLAEKYGVPD